MTRIIVESIDDMPGEARDGIPLGCVLETGDAKGPTVVAFGKGSTFSAKGLQIIAATLMTFVALFDFGDEPDSGDPVKVRATDIRAALQWLRRHYCGSFCLHVEAATVYLGEFACERAEDHS